MLIEERRHENARNAVRRGVSVRIKIPIDSRLPGMITGCDRTPNDCTCITNIGFPPNYGSRAWHLRDIESLIEDGLLRVVPLVTIISNVTIVVRMAGILENPQSCILKSQSNICCA